MYRDKQSDFSSAIDSVAYSPVVTGDIARWGVEGVTGYNKDTGKFHSKVPQVLKNRAPRVAGAVQGTLDKTIVKGLNKFKDSVSEKTFSNVAKGYKWYGRGMNTIGLAGLAVPAASIGYQIYKQMRSNPTSSGAAPNQPTKKANSETALGPLNYRRPSLARVFKHNKFKHEANALTGLNKQASLRKAYDIEIPILYDMCCGLEKEFVMNSKQAHEMAADRLLNQDTYIKGDLNDFKGFINGGYRELQSTGTTPYYIRFVHVNPECQGQGIAKSLVSDVIEKTASETGYWMQICQTNTPMQKVATALGFNLIDEWDQGTDVTGVWFKE